MKMRISIIFGTMLPCLATVVHPRFSTIQHTKSANKNVTPVIKSVMLNGSQPASDGQSTWYAISGVTRSKITIPITPAPTSCSIIAGNKAGDFAISSSGVISVTAQGATDLNGSSDLSTYTLTITCSNAAGRSSPTKVAVNVYTDGAGTCAAAANAG